jgi:hypothetical protein
MAIRLERTLKKMLGRGSVIRTKNFIGERHGVTATGGIDAYLPRE